MATARTQSPLVQTARIAIRLCGHP